MDYQSRYNIIVSDVATQMLVSHAAFLAQVSTSAAERLVDAFEYTTKTLECMPQRCPYVKGDYIDKKAYRFILFEERYMLIFQIEDDTVYVDYVVDTRQDYSWLLN